VSVNPYAPPTAVVADVAARDEVEAGLPFFAVSTTKLVVMALCTFSLYEVYWFYRQWKRIEERERDGIVSWARAIFAVFFCYFCFARIRDYDTGRRTGPTLAAGPLAIAWIVTTLLQSLPDPYWVISLGAPLFLVPVQRHVNRLNTAVNPSHDPNARFSAWNWLAVGLGGLLLVTVIAAFFLPEVE
jgi:hypothetical protein